MIVHLELRCPGVEACCLEKNHPRYDFSSYQPTQVFKNSVILCFMMSSRSSKMWHSVGTMARGLSVPASWGRIKRLEGRFRSDLGWQSRFGYGLFGVKIWDTAARHLLQEFVGHETAVCCLGVAPGIARLGRGSFGLEQC